MFYILGLNMNEGVEDDLILFGDLFFFSLLMLLLLIGWLVLFVLVVGVVPFYFLFISMKVLLMLFLFFRKWGKKMKNLSGEDEENKSSFSPMPK